jgi:WD40 repeat protein
MIDKSGRGQSSTVVDPGGRWVAFDTNFTTVPGPVSVVEVVALDSGERLARIAIRERVTLSTPPSGRFLLAGHLDRGESFVLDTTTWEQRPSGLGAGEVTASAFSPDGRHLVTVDLGGDLTLRDPETFTPIRVFQGESGAANPFTWLNLAFSDDGRYLVSAHDGRGRLWDVEHGTLVGGPVDSLEATAPSAVPGAHAGFVTAAPRSVQYWRFDPDSWPATACRLAGRNLTRAEWEQFGPRDQPYHATCPQWPAA